MLLDRGFTSTPQQLNIAHSVGTGHRDTLQSNQPESEPQETPVESAEEEQTVESRED